MGFQEIRTELLTSQGYTQMLSRPQPLPLFPIRGAQRIPHEKASGQQTDSLKQIESLCFSLDFFSPINPFPSADLLSIPNINLISTNCILEAISIFRPGQSIWLTDWLTDWLTEWLTDWLTEWLDEIKNPKPKLTRTAGVSVVTFSSYCFWMVWGP